MFTWVSSRRSLHLIFWNAAFLSGFSKQIFEIMDLRWRLRWMNGIRPMEIQSVQFLFCSYALNIWKHHWFLIVIIFLYSFDCTTQYIFYMFFFYINHIIVAFMRSFQHTDLIEKCVIHFFSFMDQIVILIKLFLVIYTTFWTRNFMKIIIKNERAIFQLVIGFLIFV